MKQEVYFYVFQEIATGKFADCNGYVSYSVYDEQVSRRYSFEDALCELENFDLPHEFKVVLVKATYEQIM